MLKKIVLVFAALAVAKAQLPSLGWCPEYLPMPDFDLNRFLGVWHEAERYFQLSEVISRCLSSNYTRDIDGKVRVYNEVTNRFTGVKRVVEGEIKPAASKSEEGKFSVKYTNVPLTPVTEYSVLETDYENYAVLWSCSGIGPLHAQSAWVMTKTRKPSSETMKKAHHALDNHNIWRRYLVQSDQTDCSHEAPETATAGSAPASAPAPAAAAVPPSVPAPAAPAAPAPAPESIPVKEESAAKKSTEGNYLRSAAILQDAEPADESRKENIGAEAADERVESSPVADGPAEGLRAEPAVLLPEAIEEAKPSQDAVPKPITPETIPEVILKVAESTNKEIAEPVPAAAAEEPILVGAESTIVEVAIPAYLRPEPEIDAADEPSEAVEEAQQPAVVEFAAEGPESDGEPAAQQEPLKEEKPSLVVEEDKPAEEPLPIVEAIIESAEKPKKEEPVEAVEPAAAISKPEIVESQAAAAEKIEKIPETEEVVKPLETSNAAEEPLAETAKVSEPAVEQPFKSFDEAPLPETISETLSEPSSAFVPETLENAAAVQPLKSVITQNGEIKAEKAESAPESKP